MHPYKSLKWHYMIVTGTTTIRRRNKLFTLTNVYELLREYKHRSMYIFTNSINSYLQSKKSF